MEQGASTEVTRFLDEAAVHLQAGGLGEAEASAWLGGVYYPKLPAIISLSDPDQAGWIELDVPRDD